MKSKDFKEGLCVVDKEGNESVIISTKYFGCMVICLRKIRNLETNEEGYRSETFAINNMDASYYNVTPVPHFCSVENSYSILQKHINNWCYIFGAASVTDREHEMMTDAMYFKLENGHYFEVIVCYQYGRAVEYPVLWINETEYLDELHWLNSVKDEKKEYYFFELYPLRLKEAYPDLIGFRFLYNDGGKAFNLSCSPSNVKNELDTGCLYHTICHYDLRDFLRLVTKYKI